MDLRLARLMSTLERDEIEGVLCAWPQHVLLLSGYAPRIGPCLCLASRARGIILVVPEGDAATAHESAADLVLLYSGSADTSLRHALEVLDRQKVIAPGMRLGYEAGSALVPAEFPALGMVGLEAATLYRETWPGTKLVDAGEILRRLAAVKLKPEIDQIRRAVEVIRHGLIAARQVTVPGHTEADVAGTILAALYPAGYGLNDVRRMSPHVQVVTSRRLAGDDCPATGNTLIQPGDAVLVQVMLALDGYWATLCRTFFAGRPGEEWIEAYETCRRAQEAMLALERPDIGVGRVTAAVERVLRATGHELVPGPLGHGIGFQALDRQALPIMTAEARERLEPGMVHTLDLALQVAEAGRVALTDDVVLREQGAELISAAIPRTLDWLITR